VIALHLLLLVAGVCSLGAAGLRWSSRLVVDLAPRIFGAISLAAGVAVAESLGLGLVGQGASPWWLSTAAILTYLVARFSSAAPAPLVREQVATRFSDWGVATQAVAGGLAALVAGVAAFQLWHPTLGGDGLRYHSAEPAIWISDGHPGSFHQTLFGFPTQAYPKTIEVLVEWFYAIARTPVAAIPLTIGFAVLAAASVYVALRRLRVSPLLAALATAAGLLLPLDVVETSGVYSDLPALAWLACSTALCVTAADDPGATGLAAVAAGLAIGTKPSTGPLALIGLGWALWLNRRWVIANLRRLLAPAALALGLGSVWYIANWVVYGAPLWPFSRFPSGPQVPIVWQEYSAKFASDPIHVLRVVGLHPLLTLFAGGLVLLVAVPVVVVAAFLPSSRPTRRTVLIGAGLVAVEVLLWADSEFTGLAHDRLPVILTGLRYLTPAPLAAAALLALASRGGAIIRALAAAILGAALVTDVWEVHRQSLGFPFRPSLLICFGLLVAGALVAVLAARTTWFAAVLRHNGLAVAAAIAVGLVMIAPASSFLDHYLSVSRRHGFGDGPVLAFLKDQPGWAHGHAPIAAGATAYATLAGPSFAHPLSYIPDNEPCASVRRAAQTGWVVLEPLRNELLSSLDYVHAPDCMAGVTPAATVAGGVKIYAPARLLR
jgi:hypothetical protein